MGPEAEPRVSLLSFRKLTLNGLRNQQDVTFRPPGIEADVDKSQHSAKIGHLNALRWVCSSRGGTAVIPAVRRGGRDAGVAD